MARFFLPETVLGIDQVVTLPADVLKHLRTVLRIKPGAEVDLLDGMGQVARASIVEDFSARVLALRYEPAPVCHLSLIQGVPKGEKLELVLQKGTELGVNAFFPTQMERSVGKLKADREQKRLVRWQRIIQAAACQSGQAYLPQLELKSSLDSAIDAIEADLKLILWEESAQPLDLLLPESPPQRVAVIVGPEGGITEQEAENAAAAGYQSVSLGPRILRTETAGLAIMTILQYLYGDLAKGRNSKSAVCQGKDES